MLVGFISHNDLFLPFTSKYCSQHTVHHLYIQTTIIVLYCIGSLSVLFRKTC